MATPKLTRSELKTINAAVEHFQQQRHAFEISAKALSSALADNPELAPYIHFIKYRVKDPDHLRDKLKRKALDAKSAGEAPSISVANLFNRVTDLAGVRILHLHTEQVQQIAQLIGSIIREYHYVVVEGPTAMCWDREYEALFKGWGIKPESRDSMYTSVHYVLRPNQETHITIELQVRTLMEEVWGEVSHKVNYPHESQRRACIDQLKVLARITSGCTRLVDSIFKSHVE